MRLGLITDIHEHVADLKLALAACDRQHADRILCLGDLLEKGEALRETVALLDERGIAGVWGNHDFGLCHNPGPWVRERYAGPVLDYLTTFRPRLELADCLFTHVEPWLDPTDVTQLWFYEGLPDTPETAARSFAASGQRVLFMGHHHRWLLTTPERSMAWDGRQPVCLRPPDRYLIAVGAVCHGSCAVYDTESHKLTPLAFRES
jgi:hypothetical protein